MKKFQICCIITILFCELFAVNWCDLSKDIPKCKSTDNENCIARTTEEIFRLYPTGSGEFGLPDISALNITNFKVQQANSSSPIQINIEFLTCTFHGIEKAHILRTVGFDKEMKNAELEAFISRLVLKGDYVMDGKILLLPINGKGKLENEFFNNNLKLRIEMIKQERDRKTFFKIKKFSTTIAPELLFFNLENLVRGNIVLSKTVNDVLNENWQDVWTELQDGFNHAIEIVLKDVVNQVFSNLSIEELFLD